MCQSTKVTPPDKIGLFKRSRSQTDISPLPSKYFYLQTQHKSLFLITNSSSEERIIGYFTLRSREIDSSVVLVSQQWPHLHNNTPTQCLKHLFQSHGITRVSLSVSIRDYNGFMFFKTIEVWWLAHIPAIWPRCLMQPCHYAGENFVNSWTTRSHYHPKPFQRIPMTLIVAQVIFQF